MAYFHTNVLDNQIKALPTIDTASGSVATFDTDLTENLIECVCDIQYQQASGTPTPANPIPIQVFDSLTLYHNDINMWDEQWELGDIDATGVDIPSTTNIRSKGYVSVVNDREYYFHSSYNLKMRYYDSNKNFIGTRDKNGNGNAQNNTRVMPSNCKYIKFVVPNQTTYNHDISINYPSTDTQYHAFNGAYIPFGQTVAKGTLNVTTGKLEITHKYIIYTGDVSESWYYSEQSGTGRRRVFLGAGALTNVSPVESDVVSNMFVYSSDNSYYPDVDKMYINSTPSLLLGVDNSITSVSDWRTFLSNNNLQIVVKLATPITLQLSATQITALLNENNIWCDTNGDTSVKYLLSVGKKII